MHSAPYSIHPLVDHFPPPPFSFCNMLSLFMGQRKIQGSIFIAHLNFGERLKYAGSARSADNCPISNSTLQELVHIQGIPLTASIS